MFRTLLIANRGEIACRIARTAERLGIHTVAVYSDADAGARHTRVTDEAIRIGPANARDSYLSIDAILSAARAAGAQAVHPGYGFLAESPQFAERCAAAGITLIGPAAQAIRQMGTKDHAKTLMQQAGVPVVPGYFGEHQDDAFLAAEAGRIGYPLLVKAVAGGGGKGMRVVRSANELTMALAAARGEAERAFGNARVMLERLIERARHVEVQVIADRHGNCLHLLERDCSLQRRYQKVIEEGPAPGLSATLRAQLHAAAVAAARAVQYENAGTVEFVVDGDEFFFLEMNTRLQVEHPVTEMIAGFDLVELQLRIAAGEPLGFEQEDVSARGHAFEARIYAEDPRRAFLPTAGRLRALIWPEHSESVRVDSAVDEGDRVVTDYDALLAKLITWGADREHALENLHRALQDCRIEGVTTNLAALLALAADADVKRGRVYTRFIDERGEALLPALAIQAERAAALAGLSLLGATQSTPCSPWDVRDAWALHGAGAALVCLVDSEGRAVTLRCAHEAGQWHVPVGARTEIVGTLQFTPSGARAAGVFTGRATIGGRTVTWCSRIEADRVHIWLDGEWHRFDRVSTATHVAARTAGGTVRAPMPGVVLAVPVRDGEVVARGSALVVMEAMKMEHTLSAGGPGVVSEVRVRSGDRVREGDPLLNVTASLE
jgi:3-methylcrotonyl-CoA carboxylase alpha subunit